MLIEERGWRGLPYEVLVVLAGVDRPLLAMEEWHAHGDAEAEVVHYLCIREALRSWQ
jgi:hypothetical protein